MNFQTREDYVRWATIIILAQMDFRVDTNALHAAHTHALNAADLFFSDREERGRKHDPYHEPSEVKPPPGVRTVNPAVPGQRTTIPQE